MATEDYIPRKAIPVTPEQMEKLRELIPFGFHGLVFRAIIDDLIDVLERCGPEILIPIVKRKMKLEKWSNVIKEGSDEARNTPQINSKDGQS